LTITDIRLNNNYALCLASENGHLETVKFLISQGLTLIDIRSQDDYALRSASKNGYFETVKFLLLFYEEINDVNIININNINNTKITDGMKLLLTKFKNQPQITKVKIKEEFLINVKYYTLIVLYCDNYYKLNDELSFFKICSKLTIDLQQVIANRCIGSSKNIINNKNFEMYLKKESNFLFF